MPKGIIFFTIAFILIQSCTNPTKKENTTKMDSETFDSTSIEIELNKGSTIEQEIDSAILRLIKKPDTSIHDFSFELINSKAEKLYLFAGYTEYNEDEDFPNNPAYLRIYKNDSLIFEDTFEGYDDFSLQDFNGYLFNDTIQLFTLDWGRDACDYINPSRLYYVNNDQIGFIDEFYSWTHDYASKYIEYKFPTDSGGIKNHLLVLDNIYFKTGEEPNESDTIYYKFESGRFIKSKAANIK